VKKSACERARKGQLSEKGFLDADVLAQRKNGKNGKTRGKKKLDVYRRQRAKIAGKRPASRKRSLNLGKAIWGEGGKARNQKRKKKKGSKEGSLKRRAYGLIPKKKKEPRSARGEEKGGGRDGATTNAPVNDHTLEEGTTKKLGRRAGQKEHGASFAEKGRGRRKGEASNFRGGRPRPLKRRENVGEPRHGSGYFSPKGKKGTDPQKGGKFALKKRGGEGEQLPYMQKKGGTLIVKKYLRKRRHSRERTPTKRRGNCPLTR